MLFVGSWLKDRRDPRSILLGTVVILFIGVLSARTLIAQGPVGVVILIVWLAGSLAQLIWAAVHFRRWRVGGDRGDHT